MNSRLTILSVLMLTTVAGLAWLGYRAVELQAEGLQGRRLGEFAAVAEQIRSDVMQKLDTFIETERNRPYTDYQYYYIPENVAPISAQSGLATTQQQLPLLRSPLGSRFDNDLAYGYFQVQPDGSLITPYGLDDSLEHQIPGSNSTVQAYLDNVRRNLLARLNGFSVTEREKLNEVSDKTNLQKRLGEKVDQSKAEYFYYEKKSAPAKKRPGKSFQIESLQNKQQSPQFLNRPRAVVESNIASDDFISAVSHELRTPLTSIRMYTEMLQKGWVKSEEKRDEYYQNMHQETERLTRLIDNVLDFSRLQRGQRKFYFQLGDINQCIENIVEKMTPYARQHGFTIVKDFKPLEKTTFDSDAVMQIVINLIDNAIKYARQADDKTIIVRTASNDRYILIEVEDHGPGVPDQQRKKIIDEFYRCEDESRRETVGVGLGLSLVNKFAQAHKGFVEILPAKPKGALFRVALLSQN